MQRARTDEGRAERGEACRVAKLALSRKIKTRKRDAYRVVMAKTKRASAPPERSPVMLQRIVETLFPRHDIRPWAAIPPGRIDQGKVAPVTNDERIVIAKSLKLNKPPGPDGIPTVAIKSATRRHIGIQTYLPTGHPRETVGTNHSAEANGLYRETR